jgi:hypothetical protein
MQVGIMAQLLDAMVFSGKRRKGDCLLAGPATVKMVDAYIISCPS